MSYIPNLFWDVHPGMARGTYADWLVQEVDPVYASAGGGLGYSFIAEAYANFGWLGPPVLILLGYALARWGIWASHVSAPGRLAAVASYTAYFLFFARAESLLVARPLIWYALLPYFGVKAIGAMRERVRVRMAVPIHTVPSRL